MRSIDNVLCKVMVVSLCFLFGMSCSRSTKGVEVIRGGDDRVSILTIKNQYGANLNYYFKFGEDGRIASVNLYDEVGVQDIAYRFFDDGRFNELHTYVNDTLSGSSFEYYPNGHLRDVFVYSDGVVEEHMQFNSDGSRRGHIVNSDGLEIFRRVWYYTDERILDSVFTIMYPEISMNDNLDEEEFDIVIELALNSSLLMDTAFQISYTIDVYDNGATIHKVSKESISFNDKHVIESIPMFYNADSIVVECKIRGNNFTNPKSRKKFVLVED